MPTFTPPFKRLHSSCPLAIALCVLHTGHAWAQDTSASATLREVTVSSGQIEQKRFDAPAAISVVDGEAIRASGAQVNVTDVLATLPGIVALNRNNYAQDGQISIRGFGARAAFGMQGIRLYVDGVPATTPDGQSQPAIISLPSIDRIEVLRGPLAQLYGNSSGGVIQAFTRQAGSTPQAEAQVYAGSYGLHREDVQLSGRTTNGKVGIVADLSNFGIDGWRANSSAHRKQFNSVVTVDANEGSRLRLVVNAFDSPNAADPVGLTAAQLAQNRQQAGLNTVLDGTRKAVRNTQLGLVLEQRFAADLRLQARVYYGTRDNLQYQASASTTAPANANATWVGLGRAFQGIGLQLSGKQHSAAVPFDWTVGYDANKSTENRKGGATTLGNQVGALTRDEVNTSRNGDWFAQTNWYLNERWTVVAGLRSSIVTLSNKDSYLTDGDGSGSVRYQATTPVLGVTWNAAEHVNLFANWGRGFETPTLSNLSYSSAGITLVNQFNTAVLPSTSQHFETGVKWIPSKSTQLEATLFRITTSNEIIATISNAGRTAFANAPRTQREGVELAWQHALSPHWQTRWSATAVSAKYATGFTSGGTAIAAGNGLPAIPARQVFGSMNWSEHAGAATGPLRGLHASLDWLARGQLWANDANTAAAAGQGTLNLKIRQGFVAGPAQVSLSLGLNNLTNKQYVGSVIVNQSAGQYYEPGLPRNWLLGLSASISL